MIIGTGIDIVDIDRVEKAFKEYPTIENRLFSGDEINYCRSRKNPYRHFAARFAAKEAASKALGTGFKGISWKDISVHRNIGGQPEIKLYGNAATRAIDLGVKKIHASLSIGKTQVSAIVIMES